jgi:hypothetical protein
MLHPTPEAIEDLQRRATELRAASEFVGAAVERLRRDALVIDHVQRIERGELPSLLTVGVGQ